MDITGQPVPLAVAMADLPAGSGVRDMCFAPAALAAPRKCYMQLLPVPDLEQNAHTLHSQLHQHWRLCERPDFDDVIFVQGIQSPLRCLQCGQHLIQVVPSSICTQPVRVLSVRLFKMMPVHQLGAVGHQSVLKSKPSQNVNETLRQCHHISQSSPPLRLAVSALCSPAFASS